MSDLPAALLRSLAIAPTDRGVAVLIRHGDRHPIPPGAFGAECTLTERGWARARQLGAALSEPLYSQARTSPLLRCVQTVQAVTEGAGASLRPVSDPLLGEPGAYVFDGSRAGPVFLQRGTERVVLDLIAGEPLPGIRSREAGGRLLLEGLAGGLSGEPGLVLCVTHDSIALPFLVWASGGALRGEDWIEPLDGGLIWREDDGPRVAWNGRVFAPTTGQRPC